MYGFDTLFKANGSANEKTLCPPIVSPSWKKSRCVSEREDKIMNHQPYHYKVESFSTKLRIFSPSPSNLEVLTALRESGTR